MLMVLRKLFSGLAGVRPVETDLSAAILVDELDKGDFGRDVRGLDGGRSVGVDRAGEAARGRSEATARVFRDFGGGRGGKAPAGGFVAGRDGCGKVEVDAMVEEDFVMTDRGALEEVQGRGSGVIRIVSSPPSASMEVL